jgi:hypothetical protein
MMGDIFHLLHVCKFVGDNCGNVKTRSSQFQRRLLYFGQIIADIFRKRRE